MGKVTRARKKRESSYFATCPRDDAGRCAPGGDSGDSKTARTATQVVNQGRTALRVGKLIKDQARKDQITARVNAIPSRDQTASRAEKLIRQRQRLDLIRSRVAALKKNPAAATTQSTPSSSVRRESLRAAIGTVRKKLTEQASTSARVDSEALKRLCEAVRNLREEDCGTGAGGFQAGNNCASEKGGGGARGGDAQGRKAPIRKDPRPPKAKASTVANRPVDKRLMVGQEKDPDLKGFVLDTRALRDEIRKAKRAASRDEAQTHIGRIRRAANGVVAGGLKLGSRAAKNPVVRQEAYRLYRTGKQYAVNRAVHVGTEAIVNKLPWWLRDDVKYALSTIRMVDGLDESADGPPVSDQTSTQPALASL